MIISDKFPFPLELKSGHTLVKYVDLSWPTTYHLLLNLKIFQKLVGYLNPVIFLII